MTFLFMALNVISQTLEINKKEIPRHKISSKVLRSQDFVSRLHQMWIRQTLSAMSTLPMVVPIGSDCG